MKLEDDQIALLMASLLAGRLSASSNELRQAKQLAIEIQSEASRPPLQPLQEAFERFNEDKGPKDRIRPPDWLIALTQQQNRFGLGSIIGQPAKLLLREFLQETRGLTGLTDKTLANELERLRPDLPAIESVIPGNIPFRGMPPFLLALKRRYQGSNNKNLGRLRRARGGANGGRPKGKKSETMAGMGKKMNKAVKRRGV